MNQSNLICIGSIGKPRGLKGEFFLNSFCNPADNIVTYRPLITIEDNNVHKIEYIKKSHNKFVSKIVNVSDLDQIKLFTNKKLYIKNSDLPKLSDKEVYWHELKGMNVFVHKTNENLGVVKEMNNFGSDDCLVIASTKDSIDNKERLIPFIKDKLGIKPPVMKPELEDKLCSLFMDIQKPYARHCPDNRVNFLNYYYVLYKICELLGEVQFLPFFPLLKDPVKRIEQD